jgi:glycosyltransferase involved in cell wall biosynthesis
MMHVCYLNNHLTLRGGSERVMFAEAAMVRRDGHTVSFFSQRGPSDIESRHAAFYPPRVAIEELDWRGRWRHAARVIYNPAVGRAFRRFLAAVHPGLLHAHNIYGGLTTSVLDVARDVGLPVLMTVHDYKLVCPSYLALDRGRVCSACEGGRFHRCLLKRCHKSSLAASALYAAEAYLAAWGHKYSVVRVFVCPSRFMLQTLSRNGWATERLTYLPNAIEIPANASWIGKGSHALYVGRLSPEKGLHTLLRAMRGLDLPLRLVGEGPLRGDLEAQVDREGLRGHVTFAGYEAGEAMAREYRDAAFLVLPSQCYENAPMAVLEAFANGKPVIGADIGGIPELVEPGRNGLLFPPGDSDALRDRLSALWRDRASWGDLGAAARRRAVEEFSVERHAAGLLRLYERALS